MAAFAVEASADIDAPPEAVWAFISDPARYPEWSVVTDRMTDLPSSPTGEGTVYREYGGLGPMTGESEWVVTTFDPQRRQVHVGDDGTVTTILTMAVEPTDDGARSRLQQTVELEFPPGLRLIGRVLGWVVLRRLAAAALEETVQNGKRLIEAERATAAQP